MYPPLFHDDSLLRRFLGKQTQSDFIGIMTPKSCLMKQTLARGRIFCLTDAVLSKNLKYKSHCPVRGRCERLQEDTVGLPGMGSGLGEGSRGPKTQGGWGEGGRRRRRKPP